MFTPDFRSSSASVPEPSIKLIKSPWTTRNDENRTQDEAVLLKLLGLERLSVSVQLYYTPE